jgi:hypothetical protein
MFGIQIRHSGKMPAGSTPEDQQPTSDPDDLTHLADSMGAKLPLFTL